MELAFKKISNFSSVEAFYRSEANSEPATVKTLIKDPNDELYTVTEQQEKNPIYDRNLKIEDHHKLISIPRYKPFTTICSYLLIKQTT